MRQCSVGLISGGDAGVHDSDRVTDNSAWHAYLERSLRMLRLKSALITLVGVLLYASSMVFGDEPIFTVVSYSAPLGKVTGSEVVAKLGRDGEDYSLFTTGQMAEPTAGEYCLYPIESRPVGGFPKTVGFVAQRTDDSSISVIVQLSAPVNSRITRLAFLNEHTVAVLTRKSDTSSSHVIDLKTCSFRRVSDLRLAAILEADLPLWLLNTDVTCESSESTSMCILRSNGTNTSIENPPYSIVNDTDSWWISRGCDRGLLLIAVDKSDSALTISHHSGRQSNPDWILTKEDIRTACMQEVGAVYFVPGVANGDRFVLRAEIKGVDGEDIVLCDSKAGVVLSTFKKRNCYESMFVSPLARYAAWVGKANEDNDENTMLYTLCLQSGEIRNYETGTGFSWDVLNVKDDGDVVISNMYSGVVGRVTSSFENPRFSVLAELHK